MKTMKRYPCITAHIIAESLGYATPSCAARILKDEKITANGFIPATIGILTVPFRIQ